MVPGSRLTSSVAFVALVCSMALHAAPAPVDSEQRAAAVVVSAHHFLLDRSDISNTRQLLINVTHPARALVNRGLSMLAGVTTPAALAKTSGIAVPCQLGGNLTAQLPRGAVRTLRMNFNGCVIDEYDLQSTYNGALEVVLVGDRFNVSAVPSLRVGTSTQDFTITTFQSFPPYSDITDTQSYNVRMTGVIPMTQPRVGFYFTGAFAYDVTGYWDAYSTIVPPDPIYGLPSEHRQRITAEHVVAAGYLVLPENSTTEWLNDDTLLHSGRFTTYYDNVNGWRNITETVDVQGLRIRTKELYGIGRQVAVDGRAKLNWDPTRGAGCVNGDYTFKTRVPLVEATGGANFFQRGEILINGKATAVHGQPTLPDPEQPWLWRGPVSISVPGLGRFDYLLDASVQRGLKAVAECGS